MSKDSSFTANLSLPLRVLLREFGFAKQVPAQADELDVLAYRYSNAWCGPAFISDELADLSHRYYETYIAQEQKVPTRYNWHDTFNALMWMLYPQTKALLNSLHCDEITRFGINPRTPKRNRLTHFDECGLVLAVPQDKLAKGNELLDLLATHQWQQVFINSKADWGKTLIPMIFGHALYEMLLEPFIGLTAKWIAVVVPAGFSELDFKMQYQQLDQALAKRITALEGLAAKPTLKPLPMLGIPGWFEGQNAAFYANEDYFRPLAHNAPATPQLPLQK